MVLLQLVIVTTALRAQVPLKFTAEVRAGETFSHPIGHGLFFIVEQADGGDWNFRITPSLDSQENYTACLGSPFLHGPATQDLLAWRFARDADRSWAESVPVTKPLAFTTNAADQKYECAESDAMYDSFQRSQSAGRDPDYRGLPHYKRRPLGHAQVKIVSVSLKPGLSGNDAEFDHVTLQVRITFPVTSQHQQGGPATTAGANPAPASPSPSPATRSESHP